MSALMTPRRARRPRRRTQPIAAPGGQSALFGAGAAAPVAEPEAAPESPAERAECASAAPAAEPATQTSAHRHGPTLEDLVAGAWEGLLAGAPADCLVCRTPLTPRHSAGAGVVGGRCGGCGSTVS